MNPEEPRDKMDETLEAAGWKVRDRLAMDLGAGLGVVVREFTLDAGEAYHEWNSSLPGYEQPRPFIGKPFGSAEELKQAILAKTFRGEPVPTEAELARKQGRSYEPASVLLDRIRSAEPPHAFPATSGARQGHSNTIGDS
jgi:hypothetical protein